jgi:TonB-linked SusC/RagA family outer membrane protein
LFLMVTKYVFYGLFFQCLLLTTLVARNGNAQVRSVKDVVVELRLKDVKIEKVFDAIEKQTEYNFVYAEGELNIDDLVSINSKSSSVYDVLIEISKQVNVKFKQVNRNISVQKLDEKQKEPVLEIIYDSFQTNTITGKVIADDSPSGLPGVNVIIRGTNTGTVTDLNGEYSIDVPGPEAILVFSSVGYLSQEVAVGNRTLVNVTMNIDVVALDEIVVVGYGTQRRSDITGSVASLPKERLENVPNINASQALQGAIPGVSIIQTSAGASPGSSLMIRGRNSIKATNDPLIIIDGIPGSIMDVNPNDIESIEVLKDASAAAIYGSRGANGVVLITTKLGRTEKPTISYNGYYSIQQLDNLPHIMNGGEFYNFKKVRDPSAITDFDTERYESGDWTYWPDLAFRTGSSHQHNLSVSGATQSTRYYVTGGFLNVEGIAVNDKYTRATSRVNIDNDITKWLTFGTRTSIAYNDRSGAFPNMGDVFNISPLGVPYDEDGNLTIRPIYYEPNHSNPLAPLLFDDINRSYNVITNNFLDVDIPFISGLKYRINTGVRLGFANRATYRGRNTLIGNVAGGSATTIRSESSQILVDNIITYMNDFGRHSISGTLLYSVESNNDASNQLDASRFPSDLLKWYASAQAENVIPIYNFRDDNLISQMMRLNYSYHSRYLLTLTARRDGYSGFGARTKWGLFPSAAIGWNIHNETFFPSGIVSDLKLRLSYGLNGNQAVGPYQTIARLTSAGADMVSLKQSVAGYLPITLAQDNLGWEASRTLNFGLDFGLMENQIRGDINVYRTNTTDLLLDREISYVHGIPSITQNIGETRNTGFEFSLNSLNVSNNDFSWNSIGSMSYNRNRIVSLYGFLDEDGREIDDVINRWFIGHPINVNYDYKWAGIWQVNEADEATKYGQQPGFVKVEDINNDGKIDALDRQILGQTDPTLLWGLTNTFSYKAFSLNVFVHGVYGRTRLNPLKNDHAQAEVKLNRTLKNWWTPENTNTNWIANHYNAQFQGGVLVPVYENADFLRVKDISLSYNLPHSLSDRIGLNQFRIYITGRNLFTFTKWDGLDPELASQTSIPLQKEYVLGMRIDF